MTTPISSIDHLSASSAHGRWTLLYDGDCGFCKWIVAGVLGWDRQNRVLPRALQSSEGEALLGDLTPEERLASVHLISPEGERFSAGSVPGELLRLLPGGRIPALVLGGSPRLTSRAYDWVADHRSELSSVVPTTIKRRASARVEGVETEEAKSA